MAHKQENMVCTFKLDGKLDLEAIASEVEVAEYDPKCFNALIMRFENPRTTAIISPSGEVVCVGAKNDLEAKMTTIMCVGYVKKVMGTPNVNVKDFKIEGASPYIDAKDMPHYIASSLRSIDCSLKNDKRSDGFFAQIGSCFKLLLDAMGFNNGNQHKSSEIVEDDYKTFNREFSLLSKCMVKK